MAKALSQQSSFLRKWPTFPVLWCRFMEYYYTNNNLLMFLILWSKKLCSFLRNRVWLGLKQVQRVHSEHVDFSSNFNSCCKRLCEAIGPHLREDERCDSTLAINQGWEFAHRFSGRIARFFEKNERTSDLLKKKRAIHSFAHFGWATWANRSWSLIFGGQPERFAHIAHFWWANWAIRSWSLICLERPERDAHSRSFVLSDLSESLTVAHLIGANERIPSPAINHELFIYTVRKIVLADFAVCDCWNYCKAPCDVKFHQIEGNSRLFCHIELSNSVFT